MLDFLRTLLAAPSSDRPGSPTPQRALAVLLVEAARVDGQYGLDEQHAADALLAGLLNLEPSQATSLRLGAEADQRDAPDLVRFTRVIKTTFSEAERVSVIEALWSIVLHDGQRHPREDALMRRIAPLLGVSDRDSALARQRAASDT